MKTKVRNLFLNCMCLIYLAAFGSIYCQSPGIYGDNGILPVRLVAAPDAKSFYEIFSNRPIVSFAGLFGLTAAQAFDLLCLAGVFFSFLSFVWPFMNNSLTFLVLWLLYFSLYEVGQTFLWFQWDILLLETGVLCIIMAFNGTKDEPYDGIGIFMVRWLLFRLMFASGVVKLTSECPTWWGLTALDWHYESQCIPTPAAWYFHQLPSWFQRLSVAATLLIEIVAPFLFFSPIRNLRIVAFFMQLLLQVLIIISGNYNFFNGLTIVLCLSLLSDEDLPRIGKSNSIDMLNNGKDGSKRGWSSFRSLQRFLCFVIYSGLIYGSITLFDLKVDVENRRITSEIVFSKHAFYDFLRRTVPVSICIGLVTLVWSIISSIWSCLKMEGLMRKLRSLFFCIAVCIVSASIFMVSLVPYTTIDSQSHSRLPRSIRSLYQKINRFSIVNSYGLFRSMTGVGGRPEVIIEGSDPSTPHIWKEYEFLYKPGNISRRLPFVAPHQPRLDWQMWFAALGSYQHNPWFINLAYRLLTNEPDVLELIQHNPFPHYPPKYIRARSYIYHYTTVDRGKSLKNAWWWREFSHEYLPPISVEDRGLIEYLRGSGILGRKPKQRSRNFLTRLIGNIRSHIRQPEGFYFVSVLLITSLITKSLKVGVFN